MTKRSKRKKGKKIKFKEFPKELIIKTKTDWLKKALVNKKKYEKNYKNSIKNNDAFWKKEGKRITWIKPYKKIKDIKYSRSRFTKNRRGKSRSRFNKKWKEQNCSNF